MGKSTGQECEVDQVTLVTIRVWKPADQAPVWALPHSGTGVGTGPLAPPGRAVVSICEEGLALLQGRGSYKVSSPEQVSSKSRPALKPPHGRWVASQQ